MFALNFQIVAALVDDAMFSIRLYHTGVSPGIEGS
jgi:hypothetical protein